MSMLQLPMWECRRKYDKQKSLKVKDSKFCDKNSPLAVVSFSFNSFFVCLFTLLDFSNTYLIYMMWKASVPVLLQRRPY